MNQKLKKIGVDLDEVLAELLQGCIDLHGGKLGDVDINWNDVRGYNLDEHYPVSRDVVVDFFYKPFTHETFEESIVPVIGAFEKLQEFKDAGYEIHVITARRDIIKDHTLRFLDKHYSGLIHDVHFANHFSEDAVEKHEICQKLGIECMIEDNYDYALGIAESGIQTYLIEKPWNIQRTQNHPKLVRVKAWEYIVL